MIISFDSIMAIIGYSLNTKNFYKKFMSFKAIKDGSHFLLCIPLIAAVQNFKMNKAILIKEKRTPLSRHPFSSNRI
jgi:hypothetical protein